MVDTLALATSDKRIAQVSDAAVADRYVVSLTIRARSAVGISSARIRVTKITY